MPFPSFVSSPGATANIHGAESSGQSGMGKEKKARAGKEEEEIAREAGGITHAVGNRAGRIGSLRLEHGIGGMKLSPLNAGVVGLPRAWKQS